MNTTFNPKNNRVIEIRSIPKEFKTMLAGIPTLARAQAWAEKKGYPLVWWHKRLERIYVPKGGGIAS